MVNRFVSGFIDLETLSVNNAHTGKNVRGKDR